MSGIPLIMLEVSRGIEVLGEVIREMENTSSDNRLGPVFSMAKLGHAVVEHAQDLGVDSVVIIFQRIEKILESGTEEDRNAAATGFLEAVASSLDESPSGKWIISHAGRKAREYLTEWDRFCGVIDNQ